MQIVIDIPEELISEVNSADEDNYESVISWYDTTLYCAIKNSIPLPEGHGRLIDADVLVDGMEDDYEFCEAVNATPTIIEADRSEK